jgi:hypothetical protein
MPRAEPTKAHSPRAEKTNQPELKNVCGSSGTHASACFSILHRKSKIQFCIMLDEQNIEM